MNNVTGQVVCLTSLPRNKTRPFITKELGMKQEYTGETKLHMRGLFSLERFGPGDHIHRIENVDCTWLHSLSSSVPLTQFCYSDL